MARGFESKSVESQQLDERRAPGRGEPPSREELERRGKRESLELSRRRVRNELANAKSAVHRAALENALAHLENEIRSLG
ncbi:MAG TPA: hypothetical protein VKB93_23120 [Thermoanaerobaculia bacterium]|nr:hypothetical protein [Thermoanaerobaculia bacterium]